jgi:hypothetical protein
MLERLDSANIAKAGTTLKGKIVMVRSPDSTLHSNFIPDASRYLDSELNAEPNIPKATLEKSAE